MNSMRAVRRDKTLFIALPPEQQRKIDWGCECAYCKSHPDRAPMWDTLSVSVNGGWTCTVHYPDLINK